MEKRKKNTRADYSRASTRSRANADNGAAKSGKTRKRKVLRANTTRTQLELDEKTNVTVSRKTATHVRSRPLVTGGYLNAEGYKRRFLGPKKARLVDQDTIIPWLDMIEADVQEKLPIQKRDGHTHAVYVKFTVQEYNDELKTEKKGPEISPIVNDVRGKKGMISTLWMRKYLEKLKTYKRDSWIIGFSAYRFTMTKKAKYGEKGPKKRKKAGKTKRMVSKTRRAKK